MDLRDDARFFLKLAIAIALTNFAAFSMHFALGRSSFDQPLVYHAHAAVYMGWLVIFVAQHWLAATGRIDQHRRLGRVAMGWIVLMVVLGLAITITVIQRGTAPFFFLPQHFLVANPLMLFGFVAFVAAAIVRRKQSDWHRRLHLCAMVMIMGPAFGRLLPSPLLVPYAFEISSAAGLIFVLVAMVREWRAGGVHPAWKWGIAATVALLALGTWLGQTGFAGEIYAAVTAGTPGDRVDPLAYGAPPPGM